MSRKAAAGETTDIRELQANATFSVLLPSYLPERTSIVSGRWWANGEVVEIHTRTEIPDALRGRITIKEWTDAAVASEGRPGRDERAAMRKVQGEDWFLTHGDRVLLLEGRIKSLNVQILSLFPEREAEKVANSLLALPL
jgi:hypothetical protein